jgi:tetratricopeptide (TPR) repeat protein
MRKLFVIPMLLTVLASTAQSGSLDSLRKELPGLKDSARVDCMGYMTFRFMQKLDQDSTGYYAEKTLREARSLHYVHGIALGLAAQAALTLRCGMNYADEEASARESLQWFDQTPNKTGIGAPYYLLGFSLFGQSRFDESIQYMKKAYAYFTSVGDKEGMLASLSLISEAHRERGEYDSAYDIGLRCLQMASDVHNKEWEAAQLFILGNLSTHIEDYGAALSYFHQGFAAYQYGRVDPWIITQYAELLSLSGKYDSANYYYSHLDTTSFGPGLMRAYLASTGEYFLLQKKYGRALVNFQRSLAYNRELNDGNQAMRNLLDIARTYVDSGHEAAALPYVREALGTALRVRAVQNIRDGYQVLYSLYDKRGQTDSAYSYYRRYISMKDSVVNDQVKGKFASYAFAQQISLLNKDKQFEDVCLRQEMLVKNILICGIIILLLIGFIFSRVVLLKRKNEAHLRKRAEDELEIERLEGERAKVALLERAKELEIQALRSQMNPHFIFNCLNAINRFVLNHETEAASDYLTKFSRLMRMIMNHSRHSVISLADELEFLSLYLDMESLRFKNAFDYNIQLDEDIDAGDIFIPPLLLQPFVENAVWHGLMHKRDRGELIVSVQERNGVLMVIIRDNGVGRKRAGVLKSKSVEKYKSMGLQITAQRLALLTGKEEPGHLFEIEDLYDEHGNAAGTQVVLKIRINRPAGEPARS